MRRDQMIITLCVAAFIGLVIAGVQIYKLDRHATQLELDRVRVRDYCAAVSVSLSGDARDLVSDDPTIRLAAADRFGSLVTYHSEQEILLCAKTPPDLTRRDACWLNRDFSCLAQLARAAAASTKEH